MDEHCRQILDDLETFLDGECHVGGLEEAIRLHLAGCQPCLERADFQRALRTLIATRCKDVAPSGLLERVQAALDD
jgi:mycothiol system anti-sigma-R factor